MILLILLAIYLGFAIFLWKGFKRHIAFDLNRELPSVSVLIPFRNEEAVLEDTVKAVLETLKASDQLILLDDQSVDESLSIALKIASEDDRVLVLNGTGSGKKAALEQGIAAAMHDVILTVDADVIPQSHWPAVVLEPFTYDHIQMVCGSVHIRWEESTNHAMWEAIDFLSLVGSGRALTLQHWPVMCNGANLAFRRSSFYEVGGYNSHKNIASGDDVFLLHEMMKAYPNGVVASPSMAHGGVETYAQKGLSGFFKQRVRWSGKSIKYQSPQAIFTALLVGAVCLAITVGVLLAFWFPWMWLPVLELWVGKAAADVFLLHAFNKAYRRKLPVWGMIIQSLAYPFYTTLIAAMAPFVKFKWKGR